MSTEFISELEAVADAIQSEFGGSFQLSRVPLLDGTGYVIRFQPVNRAAATVTIDFSLGVYTIDAGGVTFDGYDDPDRGADWALGVVRDVARLGVHSEKGGLFGMPIARVAVLGTEPSDEDRAGRRPRVIESWMPW